MAMPRVVWAAKAKAFIAAELITLPMMVGPAPHPVHPPEIFEARPLPSRRDEHLHEPPPLYRAGASQITQAAVIQSINPAVNSQCLLTLPSAPHDRRIAD